MAVINSLPPQHALDPANRRRVLLWGGVVCCIILGIRVPMLFVPSLLWDDSQILAQSWTWQTTKDNLWIPANEHSMPLGRLSSWVLIRLGGQLQVARLFAFQGAVATTAVAVLVYLLVRRETGDPFLALLAMTLFGVTTHYWQAVVWFAASFALLGLLMLLLGLLAAQRWRQTGNTRSLIGSVFWCALAPGWFDTGVRGCRRFHIDADTARQALEQPTLFLIAGCTAHQLVNGRPISGWDFLRGSDDPQPISLEKARSLLDLAKEP